MIALTLSILLLRGEGRVVWNWRHMDTIFLRLTKDIVSLRRLQAMYLSNATIIPFALFP